MDKNTAVSMFMQVFFGNTYTPDNRALVENSSRCVTVAKKQLLFNEGDTGSEFYFLIKGKVKLFRATEDGKEAVIRLLGSGDYFAEILLQLKKHYPVSAISLEESELLAIDAQKIMGYIENNPKAAIQFIGALSQRIKYLLGMIEQLTLSDIRQRFIKYLQALSVKQGDNEVTLPAAKGEIALLLGTTPETFSRMLGKLAAEGTISINGRRINIKNQKILLG